MNEYYPRTTSLTPHPSFTPIPLSILPRLPHSTIPHPTMIHHTSIPPTILDNLAIFSQHIISTPQPQLSPIIPLSPLSHFSSSQWVSSLVLQSALVQQCPSQPPMLAAGSNWKQSIQTGTITNHGPQLMMPVHSAVVMKSIAKFVPHVTPCATFTFVTSLVLPIPKHKQK